MDVETCCTYWYLFKIKKTFFEHFLAFFSTLSSTQTIYVIGIIFIQWAGRSKLGYEHAFQPCTQPL